MQIESVGRSERSPGNGEVENQKVPAASEHTTHRSNCAWIRFHVPQAERNGHHIECFRFEGEPQRVGGDCIPESFCPGTNEHRVTEVAPDHFRFGAVPCEGQGEVAAAGCQVQNSPGLPCTDDVRCPPPPEHVDATAKYVVCKIVTMSDRREEALDRVRVLSFVCDDGWRIRMPFRFSNEIFVTFRAWIGLD